MRFIIRASSLPGFQDCARRAAGRVFRPLLSDAGFTLRDTMQHIGASVGTATHAALAHTFGEKIRTGELGNATEDEQVGLESLADTMANGVQFDATTPERNTAEKQVLRMYRIFRLTVAPAMNPMAVESAMQLTTQNGNLVSGHIDLSADGIHDYKTGTVRRQNMAQMGCYSILSRANGDAPGAITEHYIQRVPVSEMQPDPVAYAFDRELSERVAAQTILRVEQMAATFQIDGDPQAFPANPMSVLCSQKFCGAWGTEYCREHTGAK